MPSHSLRTLERATPVFGALATIRVEAPRTVDGSEAITAAFEALRLVHRLMSFHEPQSELSRLNREAFRGPVKVSLDTLTVVAEAKRVAAASGGAFDPTIAPLAVAAGDLPSPEGTPRPDPDASWRDLRLDCRAGLVRFARPLWLDLGGIAKGYAVDLAVAILRRRGVRQGCVNAGGDLRVFGPRPELVALDCGGGAVERAVRLEEESLAASGGTQRTAQRLAGHFNGRGRCGVQGQFAAVIAERCVHADALTKVLLAEGPAAQDALRRFRARGVLSASIGDWQVIGGSDE